MRSHLELLGRLYLIWGALGLLVGVSLLVLSAGAFVSHEGPDAGAVAPIRVGAVAIALAALFPIVGGTLCVWAGRALARRSPRARAGALALSLPNLFLLPFGTALGIYSFWVLLNNQVREMFADAHA